jgi:hypothetical protein
MENPTTIAIDLSKGVFEVAVERGGRTCQRSKAQPAAAGGVSVGVCRAGMRIAADLRDGLRAAFRTNTGSIRCESRYSIRNGESIGPSPGLPRGGGIADKCDGVRPRSLRATAPAIPIAPLQM